MSLNIDDFKIGLKVKKQNGEIGIVIGTFESDEDWAIKLPNGQITWAYCDELEYAE